MMAETPGVYNKIPPKPTWESAKRYVEQYLFHE